MKLIRIINWVAWFIFLGSLFLPMEHNTVSGPCAWPCTNPFVTTVWNNTFIFVLSPFFFFLHLLAGRDFRMVLIFAVYSLIGLGQILLLITPVLQNKLNSQFRQKFYSVLAFLATVATLSYGLISDFRLGVDPLRIGYYGLAASFLLASLSSILRYFIGQTEEPSP